VSKRLFAILAIAGVLAIAAVACGGVDDDDVSPTKVPTPATTAAPDPTTPPSNNGGDGDAIAINVDMMDIGGFRFSPVDLTFAVGQKVSMTVKSEGTVHTFTASDLPTAEGSGAESGFVLGGKSEVLEFTPNQVGTFNFICIPHQSMGMVGTITVQ